MSASRDNPIPGWLIVVCAAGLVFAVAVVEGYRSNRWGGTDAGPAAARLAGIPREFGDWTGTEAPLTERMLDKAEATGNVSRTYQNRKTGEQIQVLILCGPPGPIGAHTPDVCYGGLGYAIVGDRSPELYTVVLPDKTVATFWTARFEKKRSVTDEPLKIHWAWGVDGGWEAARNPRGDYALKSALYKLYVVRMERLSDAHQPTDWDPVRDFLQEFLPEVKKSLAPNPG